MTKENSIQIICPERFPESPWNELEILGVITWLWLYDKERRYAEIWKMMEYILPPVKLKQFALFLRKGELIAYLSWANFDTKQEKKFIETDERLPVDAWNSGKKTWLVDFFAPYGDIQKIKRLLSEELFPLGIARSLSRKATQERKIYTVKGIAVDEVEFRHWQKTQPIA